MNTQTLSRPSATIHPFPIGGRAGRMANRAATTQPELVAQPYHDVSGASWYHEAAIREEDKTYRS